MKSFFILLLALQVISYAASPMKVEYQIKTEIPATSKTTNLVFRMVIPTSVKDQQTVSITHSIKPNRIFTDEGTAYAEWKMKNLEKGATIITKIEATLYKHDVGTVHRTKIKLSAEEYKKYTSSEKWIESDDAAVIAELKKIRTYKSHKITAERILRHVMKTMNYAGYNGNDQGAVKSLISKIGDCNDYSDLYVALCRAHGIPARTVSVVSTNWEANDTPKHSRVEFFLEDYGWIPVDPLWSDAGVASFQKMPSILRFTTKRSDPILSNFYYWSYSSEGDDMKIKNTINLLKNSDIKNLPSPAQY